MDNNKSKSSSISVVFGKGFTVNGVTGVISVTDRELVLRTEGGTLKLRGENFDVNKVDLETGVVEVKGSLLSLARGKSSLAKRLFR